MLMQREREGSEADGQGGWKSTSSALETIAHLFPSPTLGVTFATRFIERAGAERSVVPDMREGDALICAKSIAHLGKELRLSNDTTDKYVVMFKSLGLLEKRKIPGGLAFILSLGIYQPPATLEANLDYLLAKSSAKKSRGKFHRLLVDVKQRCQVYGLISQDFISSLQQVRSLLHIGPQSGLSRKRLEQQIAQAQHLISTLIVQEMTRTLPQAQTWVNSASPSISRPRSSRTQEQGSEAQHAESTHPGEQGKENEEHTSRNLPASGKLPDRRTVVDAREQKHILESTTNTQPGRFSQTESQRNQPLSCNQVDSSQKVDIIESIQSSQSGRFEPLTSSERLPETLKQVDSDDLSNVNVNNVITENINVNVGSVTTLLCRLFGESLSKQGIYRKLLVQEQCNQPEAIFAAIMYSLVRFHRDGTINNAASVFIARCREYHKNGISEEATNLSTCYAQFTHQQFLDEMRKPVSQAQVPYQGLQRIMPQSTTSASLSPVPQATDLQPRIALRSSDGMAYSKAQHLRAYIAHDRRVGLCRTGIVLLQDHTYAVLLDNTISTTIRQVAVYSSNEWQRQREAICTQLFASRSDHPGRQKLRHLLTKKGEAL